MTVNLDDSVVSISNKASLSNLGITLYDFVFDYFEKAKKSCVSDDFFKEFYNFLYLITVGEFTR